VIANFPGDEIRCESGNACVELEDTIRYPIEYLQSLHPSGFPPHLLVLKRNMPVMLLRNINAARGLCNGTRLIVIDVINKTTLKAQIASGDLPENGGFRTTIVYLPLITLYPEENTFPFKWCRRQFPVRPAFAMTINKSQGQTFAVVGFIGSCFAHGQLYVAASRVGDRAKLRFAVDPDDDGVHRTRNVVYREALTTAPSNAASTAAAAPAAAAARSTSVASSAGPSAYEAWTSSMTADCDCDADDLGDVGLLAPVPSRRRTRGDPSTPAAADPVPRRPLPGLNLRKRNRPTP
jgi:hypothetical protein